MHNNRVYPEGYLVITRVKSILCRLLAMLELPEHHCSYCTTIAVPKPLSPYVSTFRSATWDWKACFIIEDVFSSGCDTPAVLLVRMNGDNGSANRSSWRLALVKARVAHVTARVALGYFFHYQSDQGFGYCGGLRTGEYREVDFLR
jgi:hypothetical protein